MKYFIIKYLKYKHRVALIGDNDIVRRAYRDCSNSIKDCIGFLEVMD